jgi:hypothetical protein
MAQIVQPLRFAPLCQISRAGAEHCPHFAHLAHVQRTIGQFGNADGHIDPFLDQPHDAIKQQQANIEIGVGADQPGDDGQDMKPPEKNRGGDGQDSTGRRSQTARVLEGPVNFGQAQTATVQKLSPSPVRRTLRVVRESKAMPRSASSAAIVRDTVVGDWCRRRAAFAKLACSATAMNVRKARSWSMAFDYHPQVQL